MVDELKEKKEKDIYTYFRLYDCKILKADIFYKKKIYPDINLSYINELNTYIDEICAGVVADVKINGSFSNIIEYDNFNDDMIIHLSHKYLDKNKDRSSPPTLPLEFHVEMPSFYVKINNIISSLSFLKDEGHDLQIFKLLHVIDKIMREDNNFLKYRIIQIISHKINNKTKYTKFTRDKEGFLEDSKHPECGLFEKYYQLIFSFAELGFELTMEQFDDLDVNTLYNLQSKITTKSSITDLFAIIFYIHKDNGMFSNFHIKNILTPYIKQNAPQIDTNKVFKYAKPIADNSKYCYLNDKFV